MNYPIRLYILTTMFLFSICSKAQVADTTVFTEPVLLDEVVIRAEPNFDAQTFILMVQKDTTFYKAFRSMRLVTYNADNDIRVYDKTFKKIIASLKSETKQIYRSQCRKMEVLDEHITGNFYNRKGKYNYYTAELYANLFFTDSIVCNEDNIVKGKMTEKGKGTIEKHKHQLKQLMFNPGSKITGIPFMGNKAAIFELETSKMYTFHIGMEEKNGEICYVFEAIPKPEFKQQVVYNLFKTWFRKSDYSIVARTYALSYRTSVYHFDVHIHVDLKQFENYLLPVSIQYKGNWHAITQGKEYVIFNSRFYY